MRYQLRSPCFALKSAVLWQTFPGEANTLTDVYTLTPNCESQTDQSTDSIEVQLGKRISFIGVIFQSGRGVTHSSGSDSETATSPKLIPGWVMAHKS